ncbi:hypothetical protein BCY86_07615 [Pajaroellobacter abortibovis]|uniref:Glycosyl transferase family 51 domain-containing protein n=2 Tax=Pajaroellobacter abortibovis TaxID=1882918 RepID=A0A1L6MYL9_9BACT|nr:hypothetical protein BCY86_07615 [Pajaroellobacter abortibovis]
MKRIIFGSIFFVCFVSILIVSQKKDFLANVAMRHLPAASRWEVKGVGLSFGLFRISFQQVDVRSREAPFLEGELHQVDLFTNWRLRFAGLAAEEAIISWGYPSHEEEGLDEKNVSRIILKRASVSCENATFSFHGEKAYGNIDSIHFEGFGIQGQYESSSRQTSISMEESTLNPSLFASQTSQTVRKRDADFKRKKAATSSVNVPLQTLFVSTATEIAEKVKRGVYLFNSIPSADVQINIQEWRWQLSGYPYGISHKGAFFLKLHRLLHSSFSFEGRGTYQQKEFQYKGDLSVQEPHRVILTLRQTSFPLHIIQVWQITRGMEIDGTLQHGEGDLICDLEKNFFQLRGKGECRLSHMHHPWLAKNAVGDIDMQFLFRGNMKENGSVQLEDSHFQVGPLDLGLQGNWQKSKVELEVHARIPKTPCPLLFKRIPRGFLPELQELEWKGTFAGNLLLVLNTEHIDQLKLNYHFDNRCDFLHVPSAWDRETILTSFKRKIFYSDGNVDDRITGPSTDHWITLDQVSRFMQAALFTVEDAHFYTHHGFSHYSIRDSLIANIKARKMVRGGSTITMQLAKNLFLYPQKTLSRKIEELILANYLENTFSKDEILEIYMNIVEFGVHMYGIKNAAEVYFGKKPIDLNLTECMLLASLLSNPARGSKFYRRGEVPEYWVKHIHHLKEIAVRAHLVSWSDFKRSEAEAIHYVQVPFSS